MRDTDLALLPAVDVLDGRVAQLPLEDARAADPAGVLDTLVATGTAWVHLVDLRRALRGDADPALLAGLVARARDAGVRVQLSGGLVDAATLDWALGTGAERVCLSPLALTDEVFVADAVATHGERVAVGLDARDGRVVARGHDVDLGTLTSWLQRLDDLAPQALIVADAGRDGSRRGVDLALFSQVASSRPASVRTLIASGGVRAAADLHALRGVPGIDAVVLGAAVHTGGLDLEAELGRAVTP